jgi:hypothetical protein
MTSVEFNKLRREVFDSHTLMKNRDYHTVNELLHVLRYHDKLRDLERVCVNIIKADGSCMCIPCLEAFVDVKSLGIWFEDIAVEFEIDEFPDDDGEMLTFRTVVVYEREVV